MEAALGAYDDSFFCIIFTGGIFNADKGQTIPAAHLMMYWWHDHYKQQTMALTEGNSRTTRQNLSEAARRLKSHGYDFKECDVFVVSERWHLKGIAYLFRRLYGVRVKQVPSTFRESLAGISGRILRLILYRLDPTGSGWLSRRKIRERGG